MYDYYLKFASKDEAYTVLEEYVFTDEEGNVSLSGDIDEVGTIYKSSGIILTDEGIEYSEMIAIDGYHINIRLRQPKEFDNKYIINPTTPTRVFA